MLCVDTAAQHQPKVSFRAPEPPLASGKAALPRLPQELASSPTPATHTARWEASETLAVTGLSSGGLSRAQWAQAKIPHVQRFSAGDAGRTGGGLDGVMPSTMCEMLLRWIQHVESQVCAFF